MIITSHGMAFIKVQVGDTVIAFNPTSKDFDPKAAKFGADVALISLLDPAFAGKDSVTFGTKVPFVIDGPGEYEIGGMFVKAFPSKGPEGSINTIYVMNVDGVKLCHLGGLASVEIDPDTMEEISAVDILFLPIGGNVVITPKEAAKLAANLEPKLVVPVMHSFNKDDASLKTFLKESGEDKENSVDKLTIKKKDLEGKEGEIVVIKS